MSDTLRPLNDYCLIAVPERFMAPKGPRSPEGKAITIVSGDDNIAELVAQIQRGGNLRIETEADTSIQNMVRVGTVLQIPERLTDQMVLCAAGEKVRRFSDITPVVEVGDQVYFDWSALTDDAEIMPGIYRMSYAAIIAVIISVPEYKSPKVGLIPAYTHIAPVGGYVLLSRVWADDVEDVEIEGRMRKVRYAKKSDGTKLISSSHFQKGQAMFVEQIDVPPLPNEGVVQWVDAPLKGALNELHPGQRVVIAPGQALVETIAGQELLCVRHDYVLAVEQPQQAIVNEQDKAAKKRGRGRVATPAAERFWPKVDKKPGLGPNGDCWEWAGATQRHGYGTFNIGGKSKLAHRVSYELANEPLDSPKTLVCHTCDNPSCVNPAHLFKGSQQDNMSDMMGKGRHYNNLKTHCHNGHELGDNNLVTNKRGQRSCRTCNNVAKRARRAGAKGATGFQQLPLNSVHYDA